MRYVSKGEGIHVAEVALSGRHEKLLQRRRYLPEFCWGKALPRLEMVRLKPYENKGLVGLCIRR